MVLPTWRGPTSATAGLRASAARTAGSRSERSTMQHCALKFPLPKRLFQHRFGESALTHCAGVNGSSQPDVRVVRRILSGQAGRVLLGMKSQLDPPKVHWIVDVATEHAGVVARETMREVLGAAGRWGRFIERPEFVDPRPGLTSRQWTVISGPGNLHRKAYDDSVEIGRAHV